MLAETATTEISQTKQTRTFQNKKVAREGGTWQVMPEKKSNQNWQESCHTEKRETTNRTY